jgi:nicotinate-nucleotide adenylyltransferase
MGVGILGGAFDPPHDGHVALGRRAIDHFGFDHLLVRVVVAPGHKDVVARPEERLELTRLAFADVPEAEAALDPFARTVDSLAALELDDPVFVIGADQLVSFPSWQNPDRVLELARLGVATRPGVARTDLDEVIARLSRPERVELFELEPLRISSSDVRQRACLGESLTDLVPTRVAEEIVRRGLYRGAARLHSE